MIVKTLQNYGRIRNMDGEMQVLGTDETPRARSSAEREREDGGRPPLHRSRGRPRVKREGRGRPDGDRPSEGGVLSAVTGLGLTNLDGVPSSSSPGSSDEVSREKEKATMSIAIASA